MPDWADNALDDAPTMAEVIAGGLGECVATSGGSYVIRFAPVPGRDLIFLLDGVEYEAWLEHRPPDAAVVAQRKSRRPGRRA